MFDNLPLEEIAHAPVNIAETHPSKTVEPLAHWAAGVMRLPKPYDALYAARLSELKESGQSDDFILDQVLSDLQAEGIRVSSPEICLELAHLSTEVR